MAFHYVCEREGLSLSEEEYRKECERVREEQGITDPEGWEEYLSVYGKDTVYEYALLRKAADFLIRNAEIL